MGPALVLLILLELAGQIKADGDLDVVQRQEGDCISLECHYPLQHSRAQKIWCRVSTEGECPPLASSAVNRGSPPRSRARLTDLGRGYSVVTMNALKPGDSGEYKCMVDTTPQSLTVRRVSLQVSPRGEDMVGAARGPRGLCPGNQGGLSLGGGALRAFTGSVGGGEGGAFPQPHIWGKEAASWTVVGDN
ncbi:trem-like transcript 1 protein [Ornithorhynchus anatinus]|uniref:trem-like transcript 1 protein n=1 Tax=Ornithorhynchus anatinus TaxID=9258 RepID=UPI0019D4BB73|nr:trem-like transcript 1 protein [Ornithorhynchus anatinus]